MGKLEGALYFDVLFSSSDALASVMFAFGLAFIIPVQDGSVRGYLAVALFESLSVALFELSGSWMPTKSLMRKTL